MLSISATYCQDSKISYISKEVPKGNFTQISSCLLSPKESGLSPKASHLLSYLLGRCPNWVVRIRHLMNELKKGRHYIRTALLELQHKGYLFRRRAKDKLGRIMGLETWISQTPKWLKPSANRGLCPGFDFPTSDSPTSENWTVYKQGDQKEGDQKEQQLLVESACERSLDYNERKLPTDCAILVANLVKEEELGMASEARADIGYPSYERPSAVKPPFSVVESPGDRNDRLSALKVSKEENKAIAMALNRKLKGIVPFMDLLGYLKKFGAERVEAAAELVLVRGIFSKKNPGAYFSSAIRSNWAETEPNAIAEAHEERMMAEQPKYTLEENRGWWEGLSDAEKQDSFRKASWKHHALTAHFSMAGVSILDGDFSRNQDKRWAFSFLMETLGRQAARTSA